MTKTAIEKCKSCNKKLTIKNCNGLYRLHAITDKDAHQIGILTFLDELGNYLMRREVYLSASQVLLLRPDIVKEFLNIKLRPEKIKLFFLEEAEICDGCYEEYKKIVPLK
jgi:hypothetical protein